MGTPLVDLPRFELGCFPTPLQHLANASRELGVELSVKRDDLSGLAAGGNKVRKLEYLVADARRQGATVLMTAGAIQSNHVLQTVAAARKSGMRALVVLQGSAPAVARGNLLLDQILGAEIEYLDSQRFVEDVIPYMERRHQELLHEGEIPYLVPVGGSNALGAFGYVNCAREMAGQYAALGRKAPDYVVVATGSVGTYAGVLVGCAHFWPQTAVRGIVVTTNYFAKRENVVQLTNETARQADVDRRWGAEDLWLDYDHIGPGYGIRSETGDQAIEMLARTEGIFLDPTYTGKVFAGLVANVRAGVIRQKTSVLFIHTGGAAALLA